MIISCTNKHIKFNVDANEKSRISRLFLSFEHGT